MPNSTYEKRGVEGKISQKPAGNARRQVAHGIRPQNRNFLCHPVPYRIPAAECLPGNIGAGMHCSELQYCRLV